MKSDVRTKSNADRRAFIGGSDARIIMGEDETALLRLWLLIPEQVARRFRDDAAHLFRLIVARHSD